MAQVFGCMKGFEAPLPRMDTGVSGKGDITVKETSVESKDDEVKTFKPSCVFYKDDFREADCDNQHVSHARDLLSYYRFHVQGIENLIYHHDDVKRQYKESERSRKALAAELDKTESDLKATKGALEQTHGKLVTTHKELASTKDTLAKSNADLNKTKETLSATENKLDASQKDLTKTRDALSKTQAQLKETQTDFSKTKDKLESTILKLDQTNNALNHTKTELSRTEETLKSTKEKLSATETELTNLKNEYDTDIKRLRENLKVANQGEKKAREEATELDSTRDRLEGEVFDLKQQLKARGTTPPAFLHYNDRTRGDIYLDHVVYGGKVITDKAVLNALLEHAKNRTPFTVSNTFMGGDPWRHETKSFTAVYAVGGKGPFKYLNAKEHEETKFV
ncbi:hypothetical protein MMC21_007676 [Puttea exsequens]|nr:hypothetical protein [Puttea exsequens]